MKGILMIIFFALAMGSLQAQTDINAPYWLNRNIPSFRVVAAADSSFFEESQLAKNKIIIFMLFNPECEHCQRQFSMLVKIPKLQKEAQVILASTETWEKISAFYYKYKLQKDPFIRLCKDYKYTFGAHFQPKTVPVIAIYNKQQQFHFIKQGEIKREELEAALKPL